MLFIQMITKRQSVRGGKHARTACLTSSTVCGGQRTVPGFGIINA